MLNYRLHTFKTLCQTGSYSKAAQILHITQPAVTSHIQHLESEYDIKLFIYKNKTLTLTAQGEKLLSYVTALEVSSNKIKQLLKETPNSIPSIRFGATLSIGGYMLDNVLKEFVKSRSASHINLEVSNTQVLLDKLDNGLIDFALIEGNFDKSAYSYKTLSYEKFIAVSASDFNSAEMRIEDLCLTPLILREKGSGTRNVFESVLKAHNLKLSDFKQTIEIGDFALIKKLIKDNVGISFMYRCVAADEIRSGVLKEIKLTNFSVVREFNFVYLKESLFENEYLKFYDFCKRYGFVNETNVNSQ